MPELLNPLHSRTYTVLPKKAVTMSAQSVCRQNIPPPKLTVDRTFLLGGNNTSLTQASTKRPIDKTSVMETCKHQKCIPMYPQKVLPFFKRKLNHFFPAQNVTKRTVLQYETKRKSIEKNVKIRSILFITPIYQY
eukprot:TRINITY_DN12432_c0_g4_i1.p1 TRINITY_DN12432_c0_g4~~TRINITY_DN12432_c0_g4_i1.p1  ORF type:complete len:135 (+),score=2.84 TRINITY_DN12432_c0_g4_i1:21-425(+)